VKFYHFWLASVVFYYFAKQDLVNRISDDLDIEGFYLKKWEFKKSLDSTLSDKVIPFIYPVNIVRAFMRGMNYLENKEEVFEALQDAGLLEEIKERDLEEGIDEETLKIDRSKIQKLNINLYNMSIHIKRGEYFIINSNTVFNLTKNTFDEFEIFEPKEAKQEEFFNNGREYHLDITVPKDMQLDLEATTEKGNIQIEETDVIRAKLKTKRGVISMYDSIPTTSVIKKKGILKREIYRLEQSGTPAICKFQNKVEGMSIVDNFFNFETGEGKNFVTYEKKIKK